MKLLIQGIAPEKKGQFIPYNTLVFPAETQINIKSKNDT